MILPVIGITILFAVLNSPTLVKCGFLGLVLIAIVIGVYFAIALVCLTMTPATIFMILATPFFFILLGLSIDGFKYIIDTLRRLVSESINSRSNFDKFFIVAVALCLTALAVSLLVILI
jgi:hypothetical protein